MKKVGFEYGHPDEIEPDLRNRLSALTEGGKLLVSKMSADQKARCGNYRISSAWWRPKASKCRRRY
jgi:hypothetical protein